jgi:hypothetical protein
MLIARNRPGQLAMVMRCRSNLDANGLIVLIVRSTHTQLDFFSDVSMLWEIEFIHARPPSVQPEWTEIYCPDQLLMPIRPQDELADADESAVGEGARKTANRAETQRDCCAYGADGC